nr:hypothetical protein BgiMline_010524 [Biomphalaria glabrata]
MQGVKCAQKRVGGIGVTGNDQSEGDDRQAHDANGQCSVLVLSSERNRRLSSSALSRTEMKWERGACHNVSGL